MTTHTIADRAQWLAARLELLEAEKELTRRSDEVARQRRELPYFNHDFGASFTEEQQRSGTIDYNYRPADTTWLREGRASEHATMCGVDPATYTREQPGMSAFALQAGVVHHTYSAYARGLDGLWGMYQWLDRAPNGRNETGAWWRRRDQY